MKYKTVVCLFVLSVIGIAVAQDTARPRPHPGISVQMPAAAHAVEVPAADREDATVVSITSDGKLFLGTKPVDLVALDTLAPGTVYLKADARVPYQKILSTLDALRNRPVVLLAAPNTPAKRDGIVPPYGLKLTPSAD